MLRHLCCWYLLLYSYWVGGLVGNWIWERERENEKRRERGKRVSEREIWTNSISEMNQRWSKCIAVMCSGPWIYLLVTWELIFWDLTCGLSVWAWLIVIKSNWYKEWSVCVHVAIKYAVGEAANTDRGQAHHISTGLGIVHIKVRYRTYVSTIPDLFKHDTGLLKYDTGLT